MRFKSFKIGKTGEKPEETEQEETATATEVAGMEEKINEKTRKLKNAEKQLKGLTDSTKGTEEDEDEIPGPHGPLIELTIEPDNDLTDPDIDKDLEVLMNANDSENGEEPEINVVEVGSKDAAKAAGKTAAKGADKPQSNEKTEPGEGNIPDKKTEPDAAAGKNDDGFSNLFSEDEEEINPLANLINSLPEVSAQELINELEEIKGIIRERQQS